MSDSDTKKSGLVQRGWTSENAGRQASEFELKPNFRALGPRIGKHVQAVRASLESVDVEAFRAELVANGKAVVPGVYIDGRPLEVTSEEVEVRPAKKP